MSTTKLDLIPFVSLIPPDFLQKVNAAAKAYYLFAKLIGVACLSLIFDGLTYVGSLGFLFMKPRRRYGAIIKDDRGSRALTIFGYMFFALTFIFAIDFNATFYIGAALGAAVLQLIGERLNQFAGAPLQTLSKPKLGSTLTYVILDLGLFAGLDIVGANPQSIPGVSLATLGGGSLNQVLTVGALFSVQMGIAEERFFRGGSANLGAKYGGQPLAIFTSALSFLIFHIPAFYNQPLTLAIIAADGAVMAWSDTDTGRILPSMLAHLINNLFVVLLAAGFGLGVIPV